MTKQERETAADYGYDMAHQDMTAGQADRPPAPHDPDHQRYTTVHPGGTSDQGDDYGYDEAHGF
jgi:hypothetical protein